MEASEQATEQVAQQATEPAQTVRLTSLSHGAG